jgi:hypothetical protein
MNVAYGSRESTDASALFDIDISSSCKHVFSARKIIISFTLLRALRGEERREERACPRSRGHCK